MTRHTTRARGFSLVEIVVVMVLIGIIGGVVAMQLRPTILAYLAVEQRAGLTSQADTALRRLTGEVRSAVPNSLRQISATCIELAPTIDGGRFRTAPDTSGSAPAGAFLDAFTASASFDVLTRFSNPVNAGDLIVIGNQNSDDLYDGVTVATLASPPQPSATGEYLLTTTLPRTLPQGYDGGRFVVVPAAQRSVSYVCDNAGTQDGNGTGTLYRITRNTFAKAPACPAITLPTAAVVATNVSGCTFSYSPNQGATQEAGYLQLQLTLTAGGESVPLTMGAHVDNIP